MVDEALDGLQQRLGHRFRDRSLLQHALTHRSASPDSPSGSNERLEFLGDAVVGFVISDCLVRLFPSHREGDLAKLKAYVVSGSTLADAAQELGMDECLVVSTSEAAAGGRRRRSILADTFEAVVAAVYLDAGIVAARKLVKAALLAPMLAAANSTAPRDFKSSLQERAQGELRLTPVYRIASEDGLAHERRFTAEVMLGVIVAGTGAGASKKEAEQAAAREALLGFPSTPSNVEMEGAECPTTAI